MISRFIKLGVKSFKQWQSSRVFLPIVATVLLAVGITGYAIHMDTQRRSVDPTSYKPLLHVIGKAESNNNYNAYFGNSGNKKIKFIDMTIQEVMQWQKKYVEDGSPSSAVGRYQIISSTLKGLVQQLDISADTKFDKATQDRMAIALLERRGSENYVNEELTKHQFAASIAKEWAGLPKVTGKNPDTSYYEGDGLNKARIKPKEVLKAIEPIVAK